VSGIDADESGHQEHLASCDLDLSQHSLRRAIDAVHDVTNNTLYSWPARRAKHDYRDTPRREVLLIPQVPISGDQNLEAVFLSRVNQLTVRQLRPAAFEGGGDFMLRRDGRALIEKDPRLSRSQGAARRML